MATLRPVFKRAFYSAAFLSLAAAISLAAAPAAPSTAPAASGQQPGGEKKPAGERIFYASHSLMWDTPAPVEEMAKGYGIKDHVLIGVQRIGFSYTKQHWDL